MSVLLASIGGTSSLKFRLLLCCAGLVALGVGWNLWQNQEQHDPLREAELTQLSAPTARSWGDGFPWEVSGADPASSWGDASLRLGASFAVAMLLGSLVRTFLRAVLTVLVVGGALLWFLAERQLIEPFWQPYLTGEIDIKPWVTSQADSLITLLKGYLPSAGAAITGLGFGLRK